MDSEKWKICGLCRKPFYSRNERKRYCCEACRRSAQNERRKIEKAEMRSIRKLCCGPWVDPWARQGLSEDDERNIWGNALLDPIPTE